MPKLLSVLSYVKLFEGAFNVTSVCANESVSYDGKPCRRFSFPCKTFFRFLNVFPVIMRISIWLSIQTRQHSVSVYIQGNSNIFFLIIKITGICLRKISPFPQAFFASIPKERRKKLPQEPAIKKNAIFVPQYQEIQKPAFRLMFKDKKVILNCQKILLLPVKCRKNIVCMYCSLSGRKIVNCHSFYL